MESQPFNGRQFVQEKPQEFYIGNNVIFSSTEAEAMHVPYQPVHPEEYKTVNLTEETINEDGTKVLPVQVHINYHESSVHDAVEYALSEMQRKGILQVPAYYLRSSLTFYLEEVR